MQNSLLFPLITLCEMGLQVLIVIFGKSIFHVANNGLTGEQWGICFGFSAITFVVCIIAKLIPLENVIDKCLPQEKVDEDDKVKKKPPDGVSDSTYDSSDNIKLHKKKKLYDQAIPAEERRNKEEKDILRLSENSSVAIPKEKEEDF